MTITLPDLVAATADYIDNQVTARVSDVTANLNPGEEGTFTVKIKNAAAPTGVRLNNIALHLEASPGTVAKLLSPSGSALLDAEDANGVALANGAEATEMFVTFPTEVNEELNNSLVVGEEIELEFSYRAKAAGNVTISAHLHGTVDVDSLFPRSGGTSGSKTVEVKP
jgi:hypothetical protein